MRIETSYQTNAATSPSPLAALPRHNIINKTKRDDGQEKSKECLERMPRAELMQDIENSFGLTNVLIWTCYERRVSGSVMPLMSLEGGEDRVWEYESINDVVDP